jgi:hypothetical protein
METKLLYELKQRSEKDESCNSRVRLTTSVDYSRIPINGHLP